MSQTNERIKTFKAAAAITQYRRVTLDSSGNLAQAGIDDVGIGTALKGAAAAGDHVPVLLWGAGGTRKVMVEAGVAARTRLYCAAAGKFDDDQADGPAVLQTLEAATADGGIVECMDLVQSGSSVLYANVADSAEIENSVAETDFDKKRTIDGTKLKKGDVLEIIGRAHVVDNNSTDTLALKLYVGTELIVTSGAVDVADDDIGYVHAFVTIRDVGASGKLSASGLVALGVEGTVLAKPFRKDEAAEDLSGSIDIKMTGQWSVAHADNEVELEDFIVLHHKQ